MEAFINFNGNCKEAVEFYAEAFSAEAPRFMTFGEAPGAGEDMPEELKGLILYTSLNIQGHNVMFSDVSPEKPVEMGNNISLAISFKTAGEVRAAFDKLKDGGHVVMEPQETFFSKCYSCLIDKYGIPWMLDYKAEF